MRNVMPECRSWNSIGANLRRERLDAHRREVHRLVGEAGAIAIPKRVFEPVDVVAVRIVASGLRTARFAPRFGRYDRRLRRLAEIVELERFDALCVECLASILYRSALRTLLELGHLAHALGQQLLIAEDAAMCLHHAAQ